MAYLQRSFVLLRNFYSFAQQKQRYDIWKYHDSVNQIGYSPNQTQGDDCAQIGHDDVAEVICGNPFFTEKVFRAFFAEIAPANQGGEGESYQREGEKLFSAEGQQGEGSHGKSSGAVALDRSRVLKNICYYYNAGECAHHNGVPEYCRHGNQSLAARRCSAGGGSNGCGADACLIGEESSGDTKAQRTLQRAPYKAPESSPRMKSTFKNQRNGGWDGAAGNPQQHKAASNIEKAQEGYDANTEIPDRLNAADNYETSEYGGEYSCNMWRNVPTCTDGVRNSAGLRGAAYAQGGEKSAGGIQDGKGLFMQSVFQYVHGASQRSAVRLPAPEEAAQKAFSVRSGHSQDSRNPAPEQSAGTA